MTGETPGFLFSPDWPENYPLNQECTWLIRSPDSTVELNLLSLDIEDSPMCSFDSLVIRDGEPFKRSSTVQVCRFCSAAPHLSPCVCVCACVCSGASSLSPMLATLCGHDLPGSIHSTGDSMYIHFTSDSSASGRGFNASYSRG